jgi:hypothetical protein
MRLFGFQMRKRAAVRLVIHAIVLLMVGIGGHAMAKPGKQHLHAVQFPSYVHQDTAAKTQPLAWPQRLGAMRYYGGPKSPMWRGLIQD